jgi:hypothetical protein
VSDDPQKSVTTFLLTASVRLDVYFILLSAISTAILRLSECYSSGEAQYLQQKAAVKLK